MSAATQRPSSPASDPRGGLCSSYRLCPAGEELSEACFQRKPLEFVQEKHALVFQNGSRLPIKGVFTDVGTSPAGSVWARLPIPTGWAEWMPPDTRGLGPRCSCDESGDGTPGDFSCGCKKGEEEDGCLAPGNCSAGACEPCPGTRGSDCSRCDNRVNVTSFAPPAPAAAMAELPAVLDVVKVPKDLSPGRYVLGFRYAAVAPASASSPASPRLGLSSDRGARSDTTVRARR